MPGRTDDPGRPDDQPVFRSSRLGLAPWAVAALRSLLVAALWVGLLNANERTHSGRGQLGIAVLGVVTLLLTLRLLPAVFMATVIELDDDRLRFTGVLTRREAAIAALVELGSSSSNRLDVAMLTGRWATFRFNDGEKVRAPVGAGRRFAPLLSELHRRVPGLELDPDWSYELMRVDPSYSPGDRLPGVSDPSGLERDLRERRFGVSFHGYNVRQVDRWMEAAARVAADHDVAPPPRPAFHRVLRGYDARQVDDVVAATYRALDDRSAS
jgi:hypothetical protein